VAGMRKLLESQYTRIVAGSMKKGGSYSYEIKEAYIDIK
jgi:hypothetical protein